MQTTIMKTATLTLFLLGLIVTVSCVSFFSVVLEEWEEYKLFYGKKYESKVEDTFRMKIFMTNKHEIASHNKLFNEGLKSFRLKMNKFGDLLPSELVYLYGMRSSNQTLIKNYRKTYAVAFDVPEDVYLPETVNWIERGAVTVMKDQSMCGSCWAFSAVGALEGQHFLKTGQLVSLSVQNLLDCSKSFGNDGCDGGEIDFAFEYVKQNHGIDTDPSYPYEASDNECKYNPATSGTDEKGYVDIPSGDENALKKAVATVGPVSVCINAMSPYFLHYEEGVMDDPSCSKDLDHAVLVVGYGTEGGKDYWLVKNSWGGMWGNNGYIKMARNQDNQCGIASQASYPLV